MRTHHDHECTDKAEPLHFAPIEFRSAEPGFRRSTNSFCIPIQKVKKVCRITEGLPRTVARQLAYAHNGVGGKRRGRSDNHGHCPPLLPADAQAGLFGWKQNRPCHLKTSSQFIDRSFVTWCPEGDLNPHALLSAADFKSIFERFAASRKRTQKSA